jgi:hypothetical protein
MRIPIQVLRMTLDTRDIFRREASAPPARHGVHPGAAANRLLYLCSALARPHVLVASITQLQKLLFYAFYAEVDVKSIDAARLPGCEVAQLSPRGH